MKTLLIAIPTGVTLIVLTSSPVGAQTTREWITETTVTLGREGASAPDDSFLVRILALADLGLRWSYPSGRSLGLSLTGGYDVPNEGFLGGVRGRAALDWEGRRLEGGLGLLASSAGSGGMGGVVSLAYYPVGWMAVVGQVDILPTTLPEEPPPLGGEPPTQSEATSLDPSASIGIRLAEGPGRVSWIVAGAWALVALAYTEAWP